MIDTYRAQRWGSHMEAIMTEIGREALICRVRLLDPGVIDAVLRNDASVCGSTNVIAFQKLRNLLEMGFIVRAKAFDKLGALEADALISLVREELKERFGDRLGGPPAAPH